MKILFLDDDEYRHSHAQRELIGHDVQHARTAAEALAHLAKQDFEVAMLDHDLGGGQMLASNDASGYAVAEAIADRKVRRPDFVVVHSFNPAGAMRMVQSLTAGMVPSVWAPFGPTAFKVARAGGPF